MKRTRWMTVAGGAAIMLGMVAFGGPAVWAQESTPAATGAMPPRPAHIHDGSCNNLGGIFQPLTDLTAPTGETVGQRRATMAETSFTSVPVTLDQILASDHAINVHLSAEQIDVYIACGDIGGVLTPQGSLVIGLHELNNSGFTGIAFLSPGADGASTDVSVFIAEQGARNRERAGGAAQAQGTPTGGTDIGGTEAASPTP